MSEGARYMLERGGSWSALFADDVLRQADRQNRKGPEVEGAGLMGNAVDCDSI